MQPKSVKGSPDPVEDVMRRFLKIVRDSFEEETKALHRKAKPNGRGRLNAAANSIQLAWCELAYAYLIRRALVLNEFTCEFQFEHHFPDTTKSADLVLHIRRRDQKPCKAIIEIKWAVSENGWDGVAEDAVKVLRSDCDRKFLLVFPLRAWPDNSPTDCPRLHEGILQATNEWLSAQPERAKISLMCEEEFDTWSEDGDKIPFGLARFEVEVARKSRAVGAGS